MSSLQESVKKSVPKVQELMRELEKNLPLVQLVLLAFRIGCLVAVHFLEERLNRQESQSPPPEYCPKCSSQLESKGMVKRSMLTLLGLISWSRRIYRCPNRCAIGQIVPTDRQLGIEPNQRTCQDVKRCACALAIFVPFELVSILLGLLTGVQIDPNSIWNWVQIAGEAAQKQLAQALDKLSEAEEWDNPAISQPITDLLFAMGADGVMVPFRPNEGSPSGKTKWQEVKVGIAVWLKEKTTRSGKTVMRPVGRKVVAVLGSLEDLQLRLWWAAVKQGILWAERVVWLSDGGKGYWRLFQDNFSSCARGILDFYHAAQYLWKGARAWFDGRTQKARDWFKKAKRRLRQGKAPLILAELQEALADESLSEKSRKTLENLHKYLTVHLEHIDYACFKKLGFPRGSGIVESTCKWLIQQRFKGVGMRWSDKGFNNLLHLRLAWFNGTFDSLFVPAGI